jgi:hypothetical protein
MAQKKSTYQIEIDAKTHAAVKGVTAVGDASDKAAKKVDLIADALQAAADKGAADLADVRTEAQRTEDIFAKLSDAVGDTGEQVTKADIRKLAEQLSKAGVEAGDLDDRIDDVADSIRRMGQTKADAQQLTTELEQTQKAARDLDGTDIDVDIRTDRVRDAAGDFDKARDAADRAQTGIGTLRGVTDELGGSAGQIGTYGAAMVDAGETVQIFGKQLGLSEESATKLSAALGGIAIAATAAFAIGAVLWKKWNEDSERAEKKTASLTEALGEQLGVVEKLQKAAGVGADRFDDLGEAITAALVDGAEEKDIDKISRALAAVGLTVRDLGPTFRGLRDDSTDTLRRLAEGAGVSADALDLVVSAAKGNATSLSLLPPEYERIAVALGTLQSQADDFDISKSAAQQLADLKVSANAAEAALLAEAEATAKAKNEHADAADVLDEFLVLQADNAAKTSDAARVYGDYEKGVRTAMEAQDAAKVREMTAAQINQRRAVEESAYAWGVLNGTITDEQTYLRLQQQFDDYKAGLADIDAAVTAGTITAEEGDRKKRLSLLELEGATASYLETVLGIPAERATEIKALIDQGLLDEAERRIEELTKERTVPVRIQVKTPNGGFYAGGGTVPGPPGGYSVITTSEFGAEDILVPNGSRVRTAPESARSEAGPTVVNNTTIVLPNVAPDAAARSIDRYNRRNGLS